MPMVHTLSSETALATNDHNGTSRITAWSLDTFCSGGSGSHAIACKINRGVRSEIGRGVEQVVQSSVRCTKT